MFTKSPNSCSGLGLNSEGQKHRVARKPKVSYRKQEYPEKNPHMYKENRWEPASSTPKDPSQDSNHQPSTCDSSDHSMIHLKSDSGLETGNVPDLTGKSPDGWRNTTIRQTAAEAVLASDPTASWTYPTGRRSRPKPPGNTWVSLLDLLPSVGCTHDTSSVWSMV
ncbi:hypothetical protein ILYODFUR_013301 [Ilyodon furcidens]|uniref:Uncharacterized protein n=1 Tax=Ilyodon furcidens TaxID=33524 RepID=A0ABV0TJH1_9TELE